MLSPLGLEDKAKEGPPTLSAEASSQEGEGRPRSTACVPALNSQWLEVSMVWFSKYLPLPLSEILTAVPLQELSNAPNQCLSLPSQAFGTNKTCGGKTQVFPSLLIPTTVQWEGGSTDGTLRSESPLSGSQWRGNPDETASCVLWHSAAAKYWAWCRLPALVQVFHSCIYHFVIASSLEKHL